jgi:hypothetical protein
MTGAKKQLTTLTVVTSLLKTQIGTQYEGTVSGTS